MTTFENLDVDTGTENADLFATTLGNSCTWEYHVKNGTNLRAGLITVAWDATNISDLSIVDTSDIGDTSQLTFTADIDSGNVRLRATATTDNWVVKGIRKVI